MYRIYGKATYDRKYRPMDCKLGVLTTNLIYASIFDSKEQAQDLVDYLNENNPNYNFEVRKVVEK